jgi:hypothetical protein
VGYQRQRTSTLPLDRVKRLNDLGFSWEPFEEDWKNGLDALVAYKRREGHCLVPQTHQEDGFNLGSWVSGKRKSKPKLNQYQIHKLDELDFVWDVLDRQWSLGFDALVTFQRREGHCNVPRDHIEGVINLGNWVRNSRDKKVLGHAKVTRLESLGFIWESQDKKWEEAFAALVAFKNREGHCLIPALHTEKGINLGKWVSHQRTCKPKLSEERVKRLVNIGFVWNVKKSSWDVAYELLLQYRRRTGHSDVPRLHEEDGFKLGSWVKTQRSTRLTMPEDRRAKLNELGFIWDKLDEKWEIAFNALVAFKNREGHCLVLQRHIENDIKLGSWVSRQRFLWEALSQEQKQRLNNLGFVRDI